MKVALCLVGLVSIAHADSKAWSTGKSVINGSASVVGGMSAASVQNSGLYKQYLPLLMSQAGDMKKLLDSVQSTCKIDVLASIDSVAFGIDGNHAGTIVVALKGTDHKAVDACFTKLGDAEKKPIKITTDGKLSRYEGAGDQPVFMQWLATDVVAISTAASDKDATQKLLSSGVATNAKLKTALGTVNKGASFWFIIDKAAIQDNSNPDVQQIYGNAEVANKKITITSHIATTNAAAATAMAAKGTKKLADAQAGASKDLQAAIGSVSIKTSGADVVASASLKEDDVVPIVMNLMH
ncbi:MAG TPA: hypothetical protein VGC41_13060 [Kofleriaceae bacterium]